MTYQNKFVVAIKAGGKILRETANSVAIPFGSEYSILLKNLNSVRALVNISIDGTDVTDGTGSIIDANSQLDLERYIKNRNFKKGNKFKFIKRTAEIENHRGIQAEDGLIRVEYRFEQAMNFCLDNNGPTWYPHTTPYPAPGNPIWTITNTLGMNADYSSSKSSYVDTNTVFSMNCGPVKDSGILRCSAATTNAEATKTNSEQGITVPGSTSNQKFTEGTWFPTETTSHVIVMKLVGKINSKPVTKPITVEHKPKCQTCGRLNKATNHFCSQCGTSLQIFA